MSAPDWRPLIAALANPQAREVIARLMLGESFTDAAADVPSARAGKLRAQFGRLGMLKGERFAPEVFAELLEAHAKPRAEGIERFLDGERITQYPVSPAQRLELLVWAAERAIAEGEVLSERELGERLQRMTDDVALLRRYLVDHGLLQRTPDGSAYERAQLDSTIQ